VSEPLNVLFLCTGNSARSILAEALISDPAIGGGKFKGYSAGSQPKGTVHPFALATLTEHGLPTAGLRSKSWQEFAEPDAPRMDLIVTVCDNAAAEACPIWPGHPVTEHWGLADPAAVEGSEEEKRRAFRETFAELGRRLKDFVVRHP